MKHTYFVLFMTKLHSLLVEGGLVPDIGLEGNAFSNNNLTVFQFFCSTNIAVWQCTVEFLIEERTHDDFRYVENTCYHKEGICSPNICACSKTCESFQWNITVTPEMMSHSFSCGSRIKTGGVTYLANISLKWDADDGFILFKKIVLPFDTASKPQQLTTFTPEESADIKISDLVTLIVATVGSIVAIWICIVLIICSTKRFQEYRNQQITRQDNFTDRQSSGNVFSVDQIPKREVKYTKQGHVKVHDQTESTTIRKAISARFSSGLRSSFNTNSSTSGDDTVIIDSTALIRYE